MGSSFIGSIIFEFIGVFSKWIYFNLLRKLKGHNTISFNKVWNGRKNMKFHEDFLYGLSNTGLGMVITILTILILKLTII